MSVEYLSHTWKKAKDVRGTRLVLLLAYADNAGEGGDSYTSNRGIAEKIRGSESNVRALDKDLISAHKIIKVPGGGEKTRYGTTNRTIVVAPGVNCTDYDDLCKKWEIDPAEYKPLPSEKRQGTKPFGKEQALLKSTPPVEFKTTVEINTPSPPPTPPPISITNSKGGSSESSVSKETSDSQDGAGAPFQNGFAWYQDSVGENGENDKRFYNSESEKVVPETDLERLVVAQCGAKYLTGAMLDTLNKPLKVYDPRIDDFITQSPNELYDQGQAYSTWIRRKVIQVVAKRANKYGVIRRTNFINEITNTTGFSAFLKTYSEPDVIPQDIEIDW